MKVLAVVILALAAASAARSGPYLPSGWKPSGPAFYLPGEVQKPADNPLKETLQVEAEGSDFLREYGPPKAQEVSQDITKQELPDVVTEQIFAIIDLKTNQEVVEVVTEIATTDIETTEIATTEEATTKLNTEVEEKAAIVDAVAETEDVVTDTAVSVTEADDAIEIRANTDATEEATEKLQVVELKVSADVEQENVDANSDIVSSVEQREGKSVDTQEVVVEIKETVQGVQNIAEALSQLENEIKAQQVQTVESVAEVKTVEDNAGSLEQVPEGFLEYGPPGFREYGPPKEALTSGDVIEQEAIESNETRRRRFSPKFRSAKKAHN